MMKDMALEKNITIMVNYYLKENIYMEIEKKISNKKISINNLLLLKFI